MIFILILLLPLFRPSVIRGGSRTAATSKMEHFAIIVNGWKPLTIITKCSILDAAAVLDPPLSNQSGDFFLYFNLLEILSTSVLLFKANIQEEKIIFKIAKRSNILNGKKNERPKVRFY